MTRRAALHPAASAARAFVLGLAAPLSAAGTCLFACGGASTPPSTPPPAAPAASEQAPATRPAHAVSAVVLANGCAELGADNGHQAEAAMSGLVDRCSSFTGDTVQFTVTLLPGGAMQFEPKAGSSQAIPICVLNHPLTHKVKLRKACSLDVRLEAGSMALPAAKDGGS